MNINQAIEIAKAKAANSPAWLKAIDRAAAGLQSGDICVTLFCDGYALVTTPTGQHRVNGRCDCTAAQYGHTACVHRCAKRLVEMVEESAESTPVNLPDLSKDECPCACHTTGPRSPACSDCAHRHPEVEFTADVENSSRANLIAEIQNIWPRVSTTPLYTALLARFGKSDLNMLDDDMLRRVRLAIAM